MDSGTIDITNSTQPHHGHHLIHKKPHISNLPNEAISFLTAYSGLIISLWMLVFFLTRYYLLEKWLLPRCYGKKYTDMDNPNRRGFLVHHVSGGAKVFMLGVGVKPWADVLFGHATLHTPFGSPNVTHGDVLSILTQLFVAMYIFELFYRQAPSYVAVAHHVGAIVIAQSAVVLSLDLAHQKNATVEYVMCLVWGAFDVLSELWLNFAFVTYRVKADRPQFLSNMFFCTFLISVSGTIAETIMVFSLFGGTWNEWDLEFKIITPILHVLFTVAQLHAARILYAMHLRQKRKVAAQAGELHDIEGQGGKKEVIVKEEEVAAAQALAEDAITPAGHLPGGAQDKPKPKFLARIPFVRKLTGQ